MMRRNNVHTYRWHIALVVGATIVVVGVVFSGWGSKVALALENVYESFTRESVSFARTPVEVEAAKEPLKPVIEHVVTPEAVKAIYDSMCGERQGLATGFYFNC